jgi:hypothetical protein
MGYNIKKRGMQVIFNSNFGLRICQIVMSKAQGGLRYAVLLCVMLIAHKVTLAQSQDLTYNSDADVTHMVSLSNQCSLSMVDSLPESLARTLADHYRANNISTVVARKLTWSMLPIFSAHLPLNERIWYCQYFLRLKENQSQFPVEFLKSYLVTLSTETNPKK